MPKTIVRTCLQYLQGRILPKHGCTTFEATYVFLKVGKQEMTLFWWLHCYQVCE